MRLLPFLLASVSLAGDSPPVSVSLTSKWNSAPLYVEAIEFVHTLKNEDLFVTFIKHFAKTPGTFITLYATQTSGIIKYHT